MASSVSLLALRISGVELVFHLLAEDAQAFDPASNTSCFLSLPSASLGSAVFGFAEAVIVLPPSLIAANHGVSGCGKGRESAGMSLDGCPAGPCIRHPHLSSDRFGLLMKPPATFEMDVSRTRKDESLFCPSPFEMAQSISSPHNKFTYRNPKTSRSSPKSLDRPDDVIL